MTGKRCRYDRLMLEAWHDRALPARQALRVRDHIERCPACRAYAAQLGRTGGLLAAQPRRAPGPDFALLVASRLPDREWERGRRPLVPQLTPAAAGLALIAFLVLLGVGIFKWLPVPTLLPGGSVAYAEDAALVPPVTETLPRWVAQVDSLLAQPRPEEGPPYPGPRDALGTPADRSAAREPVAPPASPAKPSQERPQPRSEAPCCC